MTTAILGTMCTGILASACSQPWAWCRIWRVSCLASDVWRCVVSSSMKRSNFETHEGDSKHNTMRRATNSPTRDPEYGIWAGLHTRQTTCRSARIRRSKSFGDAGLRVSRRHCNLPLFFPNHHTIVKRSEQMRVTRTLRSSKTPCSPVLPSRHDRLSRRAILATGRDAIFPLVAVLHLLGCLCFEDVMASGVSDDTVPYFADENGVWYDSPNVYREQTGDTVAPFRERLIWSSEVLKGELPPVNERLPNSPLVVAHRSDQQLFVQPNVVGTSHIFNSVEHANMLYASSDSLDVSPYVASTWSVSDDMRSYTFELRDGLRWSNGELFSVDDILYWWESIQPGKPLADPAVVSALSPAANPARFIVKDQNTLQIAFSEPNTSIRNYFSGARATPVETRALSETVSRGQC